MNEPVNPPRVLHIHASAMLGGTELRAFQIASRLKSQFSIAVLFHCKPGVISEDYRREGIPFWTVPFPRIMPAIKVIRQFNPQIIHIYGLKTNVLWRPLLYILGYLNLIGHIGGLTNQGEQPSRARIFADRLNHRSLKIYLSNSQIVADELVHQGFDRSKLRVIRNGVVVPASFTPRPSNERPVIISVGNLRSVKGQRVLLDAFRILQQQKALFEAWIVGEGPDRKALEQLAEQFGLSGTVRFFGEVKNAELQDMLRRADIFTLLSLSEGISGAAMEAMAVGLPVVASHVGGMPELITSGVEGYLVPSRDSHAAAERLASLLSQPALRDKMGRQAYEKVSKEFNIDRTVQAYQNLYTGMLP